MATQAPAATAADASASVTVKSWETRTIEGLLVGIGVAVLAFGGFAAALPLRLGTASDVSTTSTGPVTLSHLTTVGTTPTVVTEVTLVGTSSHSSTRSTSDAWLGTIFGIGTLIVLSGAMYRRVASLSGFGMSLNMSGVVNDPQLQDKVASRIAETHKGATPKEAALLYANAMNSLENTVAARHVAAATGRPTYARSRLSMFAEPEQSVVSLPLDTTLQPTDDEIAKAVDDAAVDVLKK